MFRLQAEQVREQVLGIFPHTEGRASFFRGLRNPLESFSLGLNPFEIVGAGVLTLPLEYLQRRFRPLLDLRPVAYEPPPINPEAFRLGPTPRDLLGMLRRQPHPARLAGQLRLPRRTRDVPAHPVPADRSRLGRHRLSGTSSLRSDSGAPPRTPVLTAYPLQQTGEGKQRLDEPNRVPSPS